MSVSEATARRSMAWLFLANLIALFSEGIFLFSILLFVNRQTGSTQAVSTLIILTMVPSIFLGLPIGALLDRFSRRRVTAIANLCRIVAVLAIAYSLHLGAPLWLVSVLCLIYYIFWYAIQTGLDTLFQEVVDQDKVTSGLSIIQAAWQVGLLTSAMLAGYFFEHVSPAAACLLAALCDLLFAGTIGLLPDVRKNKQSTEPAASEGLRSMLKEARQLFTEHPAVLYFCLAAAFIWPAYQALNVLLPAFGTQVLKAGESQLGVIDACAGMGSLASVWLGLLAARLKRPIAAGIIFFTAGALSVLFFASSQSLNTAYIGYFVVGAFFGAAKIATRSIVYQAVPEQKCGRVMGLISSLSLAFSIALIIVLGPLGDRWIFGSYCVLALFLLLPAGMLMHSMSLTSSVRKVYDV